MPLTVSPGIIGLRPMTALAGLVLMSIVPAVKVLPPTVAWSVHKPSENEAAVRLTVASAATMSKRTRRRHEPREQRAEEKHEGGRVEAELREPEVVDVKLHAAIR